MSQIRKNGKYVGIDLTREDTEACHPKMAPFS